MELAPALLVPTVKSPRGKLRARARVVICSNRLAEVNDDEGDSKKSPSKEEDSIYSLYAGVADATSLRRMLLLAALYNSGVWGLVM